jgi:hypothetical protein
VTRRIKRGGRAYPILMRMPPEFRRSALREAFRAAWLCPQQLGELMKHWVAGYHFARFTFEDVVPELTSMLSRMPPSPTGEPLRRSTGHQRDEGPGTASAEGSAAG